MRDHLSIFDQDSAIKKSKRKNSKPIFDFRLRVSAGRAASEIYLSGSRKFLHIQKKGDAHASPFTRYWSPNSISNVILSLSQYGMRTRGILWAAAHLFFS